MQGTIKAISKFQGVMFDNQGSWFNPTNIGQKDLIRSCKKGDVLEYTANQDKKFIKLERVNNAGKSKPISLAQHLENETSSRPGFLRLLSEIKRNSQSFTPTNEVKQGDERRSQKEIEHRLTALEDSLKLMPPTSIPNDLVTATRTLRWVLNKGGVE